MGDHNYPPKMGEEIQKDSGESENLEDIFLKRYILENVTMNQSGGSIRKRRVRCWAMDMTRAFGIKGRKQKIPGKDGAVTVHELATLNKMC